MGGAIKKAANATLDFFRNAASFIFDSVKKVVELVVNGVKKIGTYIKKIISYCWNGVKILGKLLYSGGKKLIQILTGLPGISHIIEFFKNLMSKKVNIVDENNNNINPEDYFSNIKKEMKEGDTVKIKTEIINSFEKTEEQSFRDFAEKDDDDDDVKSILGLDIQDSIVKVGNKELKLNKIKRAN